MTRALHYSATAKILHWLIVGLLAVQYLIGWFMPDIRRGMKPGIAMTWHVSVGTIILALIAIRLAWRITHRVAPESSLAPYQRVVAEATHWLLYILVLGTTLSGWLFASARGWTISWFFMAPLPMPTGEDRPLAHAIDGVHQLFEWALLALIGLHIATALLHLLYYRDGVMRRMLP
jgi:cytochrome b561